MNNATPLMAQYREIKAKHDDCVLLFRVGDFYETFFEDAVDVSKILNIALTTRDKKKPNPIPLAGVPFHAAETYITRLLSAGKKVAICEQVEDASQAKGLVKREVVEVLTPGTAMNTQLLEARENNFCMAIHMETGRAGVSLIDVSTGDLLTGEDVLEEVQYLLQGKRVREIVCRRGTDRHILGPLLEVLANPFVTELEDKVFGTDEIEGAFSLQAQSAGALDGRDLGLLERVATGALLGHCQRLRGGALPQVVEVKRLDGLKYLALDEETIRNLELLEPLWGADMKATLIRLIDRTLTPMGGREIRNWLQKPLCDTARIEERLESVAEIYGSPTAHESLMATLKGVYDLQRLASRIAARKAIPREFHALRESLDKLPALVAILDECRAPLIAEVRKRIHDHGALSSTIASAIVEEPPGHLRDGGVIRKGYAADLDELIEHNEEAKRWIASLEKRERERTQIGSLKVGFNRVFGYYIEISKAHVKSVPEDYIAKQTLVNAERYYTQALKDKEQLILESEEKRIACEQQVYEQLCGLIASAVPRIQDTARAVAHIDVIQSLATTAKQHRFKRPIVDETKTIELVASRHPVLEQLGREPFVPNDLSLDIDRKQFALITGPNMSGKSTFLRQVALVVVLAQMGSFVPADRARIGLVDKIFTRVGATDRLSRGESTFLVEMKETANILDKITDRSLVLLDEVGRGTSTYDGLSIAWAMTEFLLQGIKSRPKTLFATHFHELTQLRRAYPRLVNLKITIREWEGGVIFLRKIVPGTSDRSYGIHAARVAGLPAQVLKRAEEILQSLELRRDLLREGVSLDAADTGQFSLFGPAAPLDSTGGETPDPRETDSVRDRIARYDIDNSTPMDAMKFLKSIQDDLKE